MIINKIPGKIQINRKDITNGRNYFIGDSGAAARRMYNNLMNFISTLASRHSQKMHYVIHITQNSSFFFFFLPSSFPTFTRRQKPKNTKFQSKKDLCDYNQSLFVCFFQPNHKRERMFSDGEKNKTERLFWIFFSYFKFKKKQTNRKVKSCCKWFFKKRDKRESSF